MNSKFNFITTANTGIRTPSNEAVQCLYNMTLSLPQDNDKMTPSKEIVFA